MENKKIAIIIGAGPAGLSVAYHLLKKSNDIKPIILEQLDCVGGISRTVFYDESGTDIGPHRLFTKNNEVLNLFESLLPLQGVPPIDDKILNRKITTKDGGPDPDKVDNVMLKRRRLSRIFYLNHFFDYPISLKPSTFINMGLLRTLKAGFSYLKSTIIKLKEKSLEDFMVNRFGRVLYEMFFEKYTEKVWGLHPSNISKDWGEQRIKGLSLYKAIINALLTPFKLVKNKETSLIEEYYYPKYGCSQLWQLMADEIIKMGGEIHLNCDVKSLIQQNNNIVMVNVLENSIENTYQGDYFISSMPIKNLLDNLNDVPLKVNEISTNLQYRDYILASYLVNNINLPNNTKIPTINNIAPDSWIYIQQEGIKAGRMHIMNNCSPYVVKDFKNNTLINLEYFCNENDDFWAKTDDAVLAFGLSEFKKLGIIEEKDVINSKCVRVKKAYPAYFGVYKNFAKVREYLDSIVNLYCVGRNGQHKYNNMDHSILSGIECANIIVNNLTKDILWKVNTEQEYHEKA